MAAVLITYDLNREVNRPKIAEKIRAIFGSWARLSESSYAVSTAWSVEQVYAALKPMLDANDQLYVVTLKRPYSGQGPKDVNDWLEANLSW